MAAQSTYIRHSLVSSLAPPRKTLGAFDFMQRRRRLVFCLSQVPRSDCSGLMSSSREAAQIVGCLQSQTVSLSAEVRTQHAWSMNSPLCVTTSFPAFRLGTWHHSPAPHGVPRPSQCTLWRLACTASAGGPSGRESSPWFLAGGVVSVFIHHACLL